jgi:hypothetical protein
MNISTSVTRLRQFLPYYQNYMFATQCRPILHCYKVYISIAFRAYTFVSVLSRRAGLILMKALRAHNFFVMVLCGLL